MPSRSLSYSSSRVSDWLRTVSRPFAARTALNSKCRRTPSRSNWRRSTSPAAGSSFGNRLLLEWTRSTSLPKRRNAWANSLPIGPPPNPASLRGSSVSEKTVSLEIIGVLKEAEATTVKATCAKRNISEATYYGWGKKYGGVEFKKGRPLFPLWDGNRRLKLHRSARSSQEPTREEGTSKKIADPPTRGRPNSPPYQNG